MNKKKTPLERPHLECAVTDHAFVFITRLPLHTHGTMQPILIIEVVPQDKSIHIQILLH